MIKFWLSAMLQNSESKFASLYSQISPLNIVETKLRNIFGVTRGPRSSWLMKKLEVENLVMLFLKAAAVCFI
jgi:hypothetical protein